MNTKIKFFSLKSILILLFSFIGIETMNAQFPDFKVYNKSRCTTHFSAHCSDGTTYSGTLLSNGNFTGSCVTNENLCYVIMDFPGSYTVITVNTLPGASSCLFPPPSLLPNPCYTGNAQWTTVSGYVICNIY